MKITPYFWRIWSLMASCKSHRFMALAYKTEAKGALSERLYLVGQSWHEMWKRVAHYRTLSASYFRMSRGQFRKLQEALSDNWLFA